MKKILLSVIIGFYALVTYAYNTTEQTQAHWGSSIGAWSLPENQLSISEEYRLHLSGGCLVRSNWKFYSGKDISNKDKTQLVGNIYDAPEKIFIDPYTDIIYGIRGNNIMQLLHRSSYLEDEMPLGGSTIQKKFSDQYGSYSEMLFTKKNIILIPYSLNDTIKSIPKKIISEGNESGFDKVDDLVTIGANEYTKYACVLTDEESNENYYCIVSIDKNDRKKIVIRVFSEKWEQVDTVAISGDEFGTAWDGYVESIAGEKAKKPTLNIYVYTPKKGSNYIKGQIKGYKLKNGILKAVKTIVNENIKIGSDITKEYFRRINIYHYTLELDGKIVNRIKHNVYDAKGICYNVRQTNWNIGSCIVDPVITDTKVLVDLAPSEAELKELGISRKEWIINSFGKPIGFIMGLPPVNGDLKTFPSSSTSYGITLKTGKSGSYFISDKVSWGAGIEVQSSKKGANGSLIPNINANISYYGNKEFNNTNTVSVIDSYGFYADSQENYSTNAFMLYILPKAMSTCEITYNDCDGNRLTQYTAKVPSDTKGNVDTDEIFIYGIEEYNVEHPELSNIIWINTLFPLKGGINTGEGWTSFSKAFEPLKENAMSQNEILTPKNIISDKNESTIKMGYTFCKYKNSKHFNYSSSLATSTSHGQSVNIGVSIPLGNEGGIKFSASQGYNWSAKTTSTDDFTVEFFTIDEAFNEKNFLYYEIILGFAMGYNRSVTKYWVSDAAYEQGYNPWVITYADIGNL